MKMGQWHPSFQNTPTDLWADPHHVWKNTSKERGIAEVAVAEVAV